MSDTQNSVWTYPPTGEEREQLAAQLRERDRLQDANDRVPTAGTTDRFVGDLSQGSPQSPVVRSSDADNVNLPAPSRVTFYSKNAHSPRSGSTVQMDDVVEIAIPGMRPQQTSVANALNLGLIMRDAAGGYRALDAGERNDVNATNQQMQQQDQQQEHADLEILRGSGDAPDAETTRLLDAVARTVPANAVQEISLDLAMNGSMSEAAIARAAEASGLPAEAGKRVALEMIDGLSRQAAVAAMSERVPANMVQDMYDWAAEHYPAEHKQAVLGIAIGRDAGALKALARKFYLSRVVQRAA